MEMMYLDSIDIQGLHIDQPYTYVSEYNRTIQENGWLWAGFGWIL